MQRFGFVFARGGSKGFPRKNVRLLGGKSLVGRAVEAALASRYLSDVIVSTDDEEIARSAREHGAITPFMRPPELASDSAPEWLAWRHAVCFVQQESGKPLDLFVSVPATAPLRLSSDIDRAVGLFLSDPDSPDVVLTVTEPQANPYFSMLTLDASGFAGLAAVPPGGPVARRQDAPRVYSITPMVYVVRPSLILQGDRLFDGKIKTVFVPSERAVDIDTEMDFAFAEFLLERQQRQPTASAA
jgi:CMP-N-acetylneuraminic acid synthetase